MEIDVKDGVLPRIGMHYHLEKPLDFVDGPFNIIQSVQAQVVDMTDRLIMEAIINEARQNGIDELYIMDKKFILEAITEKLERMKGENYENQN